jgi:hypothetical protein
MFIWELERLHEVYGQFLERDEISFSHILCRSHNTRDSK